MAQRRHHYERAFEEFLRARRIPYVSVDEARKALLPESATFRVEVPGNGDEANGKTTASLKSFDFVIYGQNGNLLIDIKGRRVSSRSGKGGRGTVNDAHGSPRPTPRSRLESWVTLEDIESLGRWQTLFGAEFQPAFVFVYWCEEQPPDALFQEIFEYRGRWYALRAVTLDAYIKVMKPRSVRWRTVDVPTARFEEVSQPFVDAKPMPRGAEGFPRLDEDSDLPVASARAKGSRRGGTMDFGPELPTLHAHAEELGSIQK